MKVDAIFDRAGALPRTPRYFGQYEGTLLGIGPLPVRAGGFTLHGHRLLSLYRSSSSEN